MYKYIVLMGYFQQILLFLPYMIKNEYNVVGVMSGTSLDGIDLVYVRFQYDEVWDFKIIHAETVGYDPKWYNTLKNLVTYARDALHTIDMDYTKYLAAVIRDFIKKHQIETIDAVCSHGHTALHQPHNKLTYQIGNQHLLAEILNTTVVCDFRVQDVELGGQGAPLVPVGDQWLFSEYDFCLNLGGFANTSTTINKGRIAFDISPVNIVLNHYVKTLGLDYDDGGQIAKSGSVNPKLLDALNALDFYKQDYPKSLGLEWVNTYIFPLIDSYDLETKDILCTFVEHIAIQIASVFNQKTKASVLVTGGGAYNTFLIDRLKAYTSHKIILPSKAIIEFKEALIFGFLGVLKLREETNCLMSVTGASKDHSSGRIYHT